jgi:hypothetical protein
MKKLILLFVGVMSFPFVSFAQEELPDDVVLQDADRDPAAADKKDTTPVAQKAKFRLYSGGQDEQDLQVQANLPQPQRYSDGQAPVIKATGEE